MCGKLEDHLIVSVANALTGIALMREGEKGESGRDRERKIGKDRD